MPGCGMKLLPGCASKRGDPSLGLDHPFRVNTEFVFALGRSAPNASEGSPRFEAHPGMARIQDKDRADARGWSVSDYPCLKPSLPSPFRIRVTTWP
jgi:hypothetical protein